MTLGRLPKLPKKLPKLRKKLPKIPKKLLNKLPKLPEIENYLDFRKVSLKRTETTKITKNLKIVY